MIVHRLLDAVFRTLDTVDAIRARVDAALTRDAQPPSSWPAVIGSTRSERTSFDVDSARDIYAPTTVDAWRGEPQRRDPVGATGATTPTPAPTASDNGAPAPSPTTTEKAATTATSPPPQNASAKNASAKNASAKNASVKNTPAKNASAKSASAKNAPKAVATKKAAANKKPATADTRKGSVDRVGKDLDSARANEIAAWLAAHPQPIVTEAAAVDGKRTVARLLWAVSVAQQAGHDDGLTAADASALLSSVAHVEVFATNVARAFRDERALFVETTIDGRSKRYALTAEGHKRLVDVSVA